MQLNVRTAGDTPAERRAATDLQASVAELDLTTWLFTPDVIIEENAIPHSHPVLTLGTRNGGVFQLASLLHEQIHWFCVANYADVQRVWDELLRRYPDAPVGRPEGAADAESTYLHLIVCWLELDALTRLIDRETAERVAAGAMRAGLYRWIYQTVMADRESLGELLRSYSLCIS
ncbi:MAG TPA: hypothetical protein VHC49_03645 [Mycobacteriales bacterium]|nr:hypothetical protein [Mycobacteriales bacterium]